MSAPPKTVLHADPAEAAAIRAAVRAGDVTGLGEGRVVAGPAHVPALVLFLSDPAVSAPIYDLPNPITSETVSAWVAEATRRQAAGEGLLVLTLDPDGAVVGYSYFTVWPERASAEIAGAMRADRQSTGAGKTGAAHSFGWMFDHLGARLIGLTAATDNVRSARVIEAAGFVPMGEREAVRADGSVRRSLYWEMTRDAWRAKYG